ncbi:MAG: hypothetical protein VCA39_02640 [Pseudomonas sp.]|uniref:hypothetical protein n=1 Tax=Pseudomonas sp. TaxID=306 RepID=UPI003981D763
MEQYTFIEEYNSLFVRFVRHIANQGFDRCLMGMEGRSFKFNTQAFLQTDSSLRSDLKQWPEWIALEKKVQDCGGDPLNHYFVFGYQFSDILNSIKFVKTHTVPNFETYLPHLGNIIHDQAILNNTLMSGEMSFRGATKNRYAVLIQGLKVSGKIELEGFGYFDVVTKYIKECPEFWFCGTPNHLYTAFFTEQEETLSNGFLCRLMTAIRTYQEKDVRFDSVLVESNGVIGEPSYTPFHDLSYKEDTALFGTEVPCLMELNSENAGDFSRHVLNMIRGLSHMDISCEYYNYSKVSPKHLQVPTAFISVESIFPNGRNDKQNTLARLFVYLLDEDENFGELLKKYYRLRNTIVHGNRSGEILVREQIFKEHLNAPSLNQILQRLFITLAEINWNPAKDTQTLLRQLTRKST